MNAIREYLLRIRELEQEGIDNRNREIKLRERWKDRGRENQRDRDLYEQFKKNAALGKKQNNDRFRISYINDLPIDWNILICLGKKNIGKSWNIHRLIDECIAEDREIVMVRVSAKEFETALTPFFDEETSRVRVQKRYAGLYDLVLKPRNQEEFNKRSRLKKVGFCANISGLTAYQGSSYAKVKYIIWDECISDGSTQKLTYNQIKGFERFISSIVRDKKDVKIFIFGNLLSKVEKHSGDPLLNFYGIDPSCGCKYIPAQKNYEANILFINCKDMFKGIENQGVLGGVDDENTTNLITNTLSEDSIKVTNELVFYSSKVLHTLVFTYNLIDIAIHIRETREYKDLPKYLVVLIKPFVLCDVYGGENNIPRVFTNEEALSNTYSQCVCYVEKSDWVDLIEELLSYLQANRVIYANTSSEANLLKYAKHLKTTIVDKKQTFGKEFLTC